MTDVIHSRYRETTGNITQESLRGRQSYLLNHTNWKSLIADYVRPPATADYDYRDWLTAVPVFVNRVLLDDTDDSTSRLAIDDLDAMYPDLMRLGYTSDQFRPTHTRSVGRAQEPNIDRYINEWLEHTAGSHLYMRGPRYARATSRMPVDPLKKILMIDNMARHHSPTGAPPWQIEEALWQVADDVVRDYDEQIAGLHHSRHYNVSIDGSETLEPHHIQPREFAQMFNTAIHSYPATLMRGLMSVELEGTRGYFTERGKRVPLTGTVINDGRRMKLYVPNIHDEAMRNALMYRREDNDVFYELLEEVIDHELAHIAHFNAPLEWLRRWEKLIARHRISITPYADHAHKEHSDEGRNELFAEVVQVYRADPLRLMYLSPDYFHLVDELMQSYDEHSVRAAHNLVKHGRSIGNYEYVQVNRRLTEARQSTLNRNLSRAREQGSPLGRVTLAAAGRH